MNKQLILAGFAVLAMASCKKDKQEPMAPPTPPPVENPAPPPAPKPVTQAAPATPPEEDGTSVSLGENGLSVKDKDGTKSRNITVSKTKKEVKITTD